MGLRILVTGGRDYADWKAVWRALSRIHKKHGVEVLIHGKAKGADTHASQWVRQHPEVCEIACPADWKNQGRAAGPLRNQYMLDQWKPDVVVKFPGGKGTADMVARAMAAGVTIWKPEEKE